MKSILGIVILALVSIHHAHCQPAFEVASITPCKPGTPEPAEERMGMVQFTAPGGRFNAKATSLKFLLEWAYGILPSQHTAGPSWMEHDRYDIVAKASGNPDDDQMKLMVRSLIAERFKLKMRRETREAPAIVISLGKSAPKLFPPKEGEKYSIGMTPQVSADQKTTSWHVVATRFSFARLNETFSRLLERVIVNRTGMEGDFDFALDFVADENRPNPLDPSMIIAAMQTQLGLAVKAQREPVDFFVIENVEQAAGGNAEAAQTPAFEVASITPCKAGTPEPPGEHMGMFQFTYPGGRLDAKATTVKFLFEWAYGILPAQHSSGPAWFATDRYDFAAKAAGNATDAEIKRMTQALLADRFHLKMHHEEKELAVLIVTVGKSAPKLYPPKEGEVRSLHVAPQANAFHIAATRFSLTQLLDVFARQLSMVILDRTGLHGDFDFAFDLTPDESNPNPLEATHVISALQSELGLALKSQKTAVDYYVIDSAEKATAGNQ